MFFHGISEAKRAELRKQWFKIHEISPGLVGVQNPKKCYSICHIECLRLMHGALNVDEKKN